MNENIELQSFISTENDIQEYHEIKQETRFGDTDTTLPIPTSKNSQSTFNEYDFFIHYDSKTEPKKHTKKKKAKRKDKSPNLMDIISSEIAATSIPIKENVITYVDNSKEQHNRYLETNPRRIFKKSYFPDSEHGWGLKSQVNNLSPTFPRVLDNVTTDDVSIPVEYVDPTLFKNIIDQNVEDVKDQATKFLDITLIDLKYEHHHHFSLEHLLCLKLVEHYNEYEYTKRLIKDLLYNIKVSRETKDNLKKDLMKVKSDKKDDIRFDQIVRKYAEALLQLKEKYRETIRNNKEIVHKLISLWSDIEMVRVKHERVETPYILQISKEKLDDKEFEKEWNAIFNTEFSDLLEKIEFDYVTEYIEYKEAKNQCKPYHSKSLKPKLNIDENAVRQEVENIVNNIVTKEIINLVLNKNNTDHINKRTTNRFHFKIYIDDVFVCESEHYNSDDFQTELNENFSVQILPNNNNLQMALLENDRKVSNFNINLLKVRKKYSKSDHAAVKFVYSGAVIEPNTHFVGSGYSIKDVATANKIRLKSSSMFKEILNTNCEVNIKIGWNDKLEQNSTETIKSSMEVDRQIKRILHGIEETNFDTLLGVISKIYDIDINDTSIIETIRNLSKKEVKHEANFPITENNPDLIRLKLLQLRNIGQLNNIENKTVPLYASQISTEQLVCLENTKDKDLDMEYLNVKETEMDPIELQRFIGAKYLQRLNKNMLKNLNENLLKKTQKDVVRDFNFSLRSLFSNQFNLVSLSTMPNSTKLQVLKESLNKEQEIQVTVLRAFNLLDRSSTILEEDYRHDDDDNIAGFKVRPLRPYVRVIYKGVTAQTVTAIGCHPTWNHTLKINTKLKPLSALHINVFDEYKENIAEGCSDDEHSNKTVHYRYYNKWLGTLQVPLHTVLTMGSLNGTFKITTPPLLFGYETLQTKEMSSLIPKIAQLMKKNTTFITIQITTSLSNYGGLNAYSQPLPSSVEDDHLIKHLNNFVTEYTNEFPNRSISLTFIDSAGRNKCVTQFLQPIPLPESDFLPRNPRGESAISKSSGLSRSSSSSGKRKEHDAEKLSLEERESVYSVYEGDNLTKMINASMRYVSLIPCYEVTESHVVTLLGLELLKALHGSPLDHTLLLASYFIYLGIKCWVAIGLGLPRGPGSYVLIKYDLSTRRIVLENDQLFRTRGFLNKNDGYTWYVCDASSGEKCELRDVGSPMKTVEYIFDNDNIWVNIQASQECENISFDFSRSSDWQPVFDKTVFVMKQPIVKDLVYSPASSVEALRLALETRIKGKVQKWRSHMKTIWNRYCSGLLRDMLPHWEFWAFNQTSQKPGHSQKLKQLMVTYKIFGFPLNMPYVNAKSVISTVKSTGLHATDDPNVEFALAVEVYSYPNNVLSVWVFLASITRV